MKKFHLTNTYALINFDAATCSTQSEVLNSKSFYLVLKSFIKNLKDKNHYLVNDLKDINSNDILNFYKLLLVYNLDDAIKQVNNINDGNISSLYDFSEEFYNYFRKLERFGFLKGSKNYDPNLKVKDLINTGATFNKTIITLYRTIAQKLLKSNFHIYRQLPAGTNANMLYAIHTFSNELKYKNLRNIPFVTKVLTNPPFIINSKSNTRSGLFNEIYFNPLNKLKINKLHYIAFPIYVGPLLAFVYVHRDFLHQGIALSNMFEFADYNKFKDLKPDLIYLYGIEENEYDCKYYIDKDDNTHIGFVSRLEKNDYFGYLKKMLLTLHNIYMIRNNNLPIHGAMVKITLKNNQVKNVCIMGDSGAGKSETLEALRTIGESKIKNMQIIFDDMGTFKYDNGIVANGTETGAFVRLDDLDQGYAYEIMDRALFLNPNKINARVCIPISSFEFILENHKIDYLLYANNYNEEKTGLEFFSNLESALSVFKKGTRKAKGTTSEVGIVDSYFANPFGPVQRISETNVLLDKYFSDLFNNGTKIGELYTKLAVDGFQSIGPLEAARALLKYLEEKL